MRSVVDKFIRYFLAATFVTVAFFWIMNALQTGELFEIMISFLSLPITLLLILTAGVVVVILGMIVLVILEIVGGHIDKFFKK